MSSSKKITTSHIFTNVSMSVICQIILDINSYPEFVPFCKKVEIIKDSIVDNNDSGSFDANLGFLYSIIEYEYLSSTRYTLGKNESNIHITLKQEIPLINSFIATWNISKNNNTIKADLTMDIKFNNWSTMKLLSKIIEYESIQIKNAFIKRVNQIASEV